MVAGAYIRKSNVEKKVAEDLKSISQQLDEIKKFAASRGWKFDERYVYQDDEISGEEWVKRPGYQKLRAALVKPPFKVMLVWEQSRFGRDTARQLSAIQEITEAGVECWSVEGNRRLGAGDIHTVVSAWKSEADNEETRARVNRALDNRFDKNLVAGGSVFGYTNVRVEGLDKAVRRVINEDEAAVVRRIFERAAAGHGYTRIAKDLQREGVKSPRRITELGRQRRARKDAERIEAGLEPLKPIREQWTGDGAREVLHRELYHGWDVRGRVKRSKRGGTKIRVATPDRVERRFNQDWVIVSEELWTAAHDALKASAQRFLRVHNKLVGRPENFRGKHILSNIARCGHCGGPLHAITRGRNKVLGYVCKANRVSGSCLNASSVPAAELHKAVLDGLRSQYTAKSFEQYLATKATSVDEIEAQRAELAHLTDVVIPGLAQREERLLDAIEAGSIDKDLARKRTEAIRTERELALARREELESKVRSESGDRAQAEELAERWNDWATQMDGNDTLARQVVGKALAGAPIYVTPAAQPRTWVFLGLASYEGVLRGAVRPGFIATFVDDGAPEVDRGAAPQVVREALAALAGAAGAATGPLPTIRQADGSSVVDWKAALGVPSWARGRSLKVDGKRSAALRPISGGSDAELSADRVTSGPPCELGAMSRPPCELGSTQSTGAGARGIVSHCAGSCP